MNISSAIFMVRVMYRRSYFVMARPIPILQAGDALRERIKPDKANVLIQ